MNTPQVAATTNRTHPLVLVAAASVTALSLAGVGALMGWLPGTGGHTTPAVDVAKSSAAIAPIVAPAATPPATPTPVQQTVNVPQEKTTAKAAERTTSHVRSPSTTTPSTRAPVAVSPAPTSASAAAPSVPVAAICKDCGVVEGVREVKTEGKGSGAGAVAGGVVGAVIGNQIGNGGARDVARILGAAGGAYAGHQIEKSAKEGKRYEVTVRFEDGTTRSFSSDTPPVWQNGDRVRLQNGVLTARG